MSDLGSRTALREVARTQPAEPEPAPAEPKPLGPLPDHEGAAVATQAASARRYRRRVLLTLGAIVLAFGLYWASSYVFAYTDDAYVTSDFVNVAPYVSGRIISINIVDNQSVAKGSVLAEIDPSPFQLALNEKRA